MSTHFRLIVILCFSLSSLAEAQPVDEQYELSADSMPQKGVPQGKVHGPIQWKSRIFPGTERDYWVYVPDQYDSDKPTCVLVIQDGLRRAEGWKIPTVLDNLIHKREVPTMIGIFISPGIVPAPRENAQPRFNRSFEYDALGDRYAQFLLKEILPEVGKQYNLSSNPNDRAIAGSSSGAICAFTVAWERPNEFRRVLSTIGTYVGLRGGDAYPTLVRKMEPKPIRIFLQDGSNDLNLYGGSWWMANQSLLSALQFAGNEVRHVWGEGGHNAKHSTALMPDALRWLWRDYPEPVRIGRGANRRTDILIPGEDWELVSQGYRFTEGPAVNSQGEVFFTDIPNNRIHKISLDGQVTVFAEQAHGANGLMFDVDGKLYACQNGEQKLVRYDTFGNVDVVVDDAPSNDVVVLPSGIYYTDPSNKKVWHVDKKMNRTQVDMGIEFPNGLVASADQTQLFVADMRGRFVYSFQIQTDGSLAYKQPYGHLHVPHEQRDSGADGMTVDNQGRLYVATRAGIQVLDQLGRCHLILSKPQDKWLSNVVFGGPELDTLYVTSGDKVFKRKVNAIGAVSWRDPIDPQKPRL